MNWRKVEEELRRDLRKRLSGGEYEWIIDMLYKGENDVLSTTDYDVVSIDECGDELVRLLDYIPDIVIQLRDGRKRWPDETAYSRETVAVSLAKVQERLSEHDLNLKILDAYRPIEYQQARYEQVLAQMKEKHIGEDEAQILRRTREVSYPPSLDPATPPPHSTGAAVDLTLIDSRGVELDMGGVYGDLHDPRIYTGSEDLTCDQRTNRNVLVLAMGGEGLTNYPGEWWHYSLGDRVAAAYAQETVARFGRMEDPYKERME